MSNCPFPKLRFRHMSITAQSLRPRRILRMQEARRSTLNPMTRITFQSISSHPPCPSTPMSIRIQRMGMPWPIPNCFPMLKREPSPRPAWMT
jgi:hypothetical protein